MTDLAGPPIPEYNAIWFSTHRGDRPGLYRLRIDEAPARAYITSDLLMLAMEGDTPHIQVTGDEDDVITISDDFGQRFIYRLGNYEALYDAFEMEWPD